ncbi:thiolase family protein [Streptomyces malaysiensis]|uniref:DitF protein n=1 Tax=Streptomyces malaysiensis TaxID=92644 RepID=A0A7X6B1M5_STRMQ|nr:thiolase family protein [Streptomyces malaysiensis]NIY69427.1 DitF protein [Streptomyces malaysiensis]
MSRAVIAGIGEIPATRRPTAGIETPGLLVAAVREAVADAGLTRRDVDGIGVSSFLLAPDQAIDLSWQLGLSTTWQAHEILSLALLQQAVRAVEAGDASAIVLVAGDKMTGSGFTAMMEQGYSTVWRDHLASLPVGGPNALFALLTQAHMERYDLPRETYGRLAVSQRSWAARNPRALYRAPLSIYEYLAAPMVADPLGIYDCPPLAAGATAVVVADHKLVKARRKSVPRIKVRAVAASYNRDHQDGDGLTTGIASVAPRLWEQSGVAVGDVDHFEIYDDYPVMVLAQLQDLGLFGDPASFIASRPVDVPWRGINTSGGLLSGGQCGAGGTMKGLVEAVRQLRGSRGAGQLEDARLSVVTNYGLVPYRYGAGAVGAVLERTR